MTRTGAGIDRAQLAGATRQVLKRGRGIKPDVLLVDTPGGQVVVKDYALRPAWVRWRLGPWLARREQRIHRALAEVGRGGGARHRHAEHLAALRRAQRRREQRGGLGANIGTKDWYSKKAKFDK